MTDTIATQWHTVRRLPPEEWDKIRHIPPYDQGTPDPTYWWPLVVEDAEGRIVGSCSIFGATHWDCWWVDQTLPAQAGVFWSLVSAGQQTLRDLKLPVAHVVIPHNRPDLKKMIEHFGFQKAEGDLYFVCPRVE